MNKKTFMKHITEVMKHNDYTDDMLTASVCGEKGFWSPVDLIMREYYNNGGGSAKGFLGLSTSVAIRCADYIVEHQKELRELDYYNKEGYNNFGFPLWNNYELC